MKRSIRYLYTLMFLATGFLMVAQPVIQLDFASGKESPDSRAWDEFFEARQEYRRQATDGRIFGLIHFTELPDQAERQRLLANGILLLDYQPHHVYLASIPVDLKREVQRDLPSSTFLSIRTEWKIDPVLKVSGNEQFTVIVRTFPTISAEQFESHLRESGFQLANRPYLPEDCKLLSVNPTKLHELASLALVYRIERDPGEPEELRYRAHGAQRIHPLTHPSMLGLDGTGVMVGIGDGGRHGFHLDINDRVTLDLTAGNYSSHATHVTGIIAGRGIINPEFGNGVAPGVEVVSQNFSAIINLGPTYYEDYHMVMTNNSYGNSLGNCEVAGLYNFASMDVDRQMREYEHLFHMFAAGNDGRNTCNPYPEGYNTVATSWQTAKNTLVIGNTNSFDVLRSGSSRGPTKDGRIKPEIVAVGTGVRSTFPNNNYRSLNGTSMANPHVTGVAALLYELYRNMHGQDPHSDLIKTALCNTTDDLGNEGPDFLFGFGRMNAYRAARMLIDEKYYVDRIESGENRTFEIEVPDQARQLRVMLYWHDPEAGAFANPVLVNDLDLKVTGTAGTHLPMILNPDPDMVDQPAFEGEDHLNNIEQVLVDDPAVGLYTIEVNSFNQPIPDQRFIVAYDWITEGLQLTYPLGGELVETLGEEYIRWDASLGDAELMRVELSVNGGQDWTLVSDTVPVSETVATWRVPDVRTSRAMIRITNSAGTYTEASDLFTICGVPQNPVVENLCESYAYLHWNPVDSIDTYAVYYYENEEMHHILTVTDTLADVPLLSSGPQWLAIAAVLPDGVVGRRSWAVFLNSSQGTCPWSMDMAMGDIQSTTFGRMHTSSELDTEEQLSLSVVNSGSMDITSFQLSYRLDGMPVRTEQVDSVLAPGEKYIHIFGQGEDLSGIGTFAVTAWVDAEGDSLHLNDSLRTTIRQVGNDPIALPFTEDFESADVVSSTEMDYGVGLDRLDHEVSGSNGRLRTSASNIFATSGSRSLILDAAFAGETEEHFGILTFNLADQATNQGLRMNFWFMQNEEEQDDNENDLIWMRGRDSDEWVPVYDLFANHRTKGLFYHENSGLNIPYLLEQNGQQLSESFQLRIGQEAKDRTYLPGEYDGYVFDDLAFFTVDKDVRPISVDYPLDINCDIGVEPIVVRIENTHSGGLQQVSVRYRVNGGDFTDPLLVDMEGRQTLTLDLQDYDFSEYGYYTVEAIVQHPEDSYQGNDTLQYEFVHLPHITDYPYRENFEATDGGWYSEGENDSWQWGIPEGGLISGAAEGQHAWVTNLTGDHNNLELSYLYSPCFDLSGLSRPMLSFAHIFDMEDDYDYIWVEYSENDIEWKRLGESGQGFNWFNEPGPMAWDSTHGLWHTASIMIPKESISDLSKVRFRYVLDSDPFVTEEGMGLDMVHVHEYLPISRNSSSSLSHAEIQGSQRFGTDSTVVGSIRNLGGILSDVAVSVRWDTTVLPDDTFQVYHNRSWVVTGDDGLADAFELEWYVTADELRTMLDTCELCPGFISPFDLGMTQFSGLNEDHDLTNNFGDDYLYYDSDKLLMIPYADGYITNIVTDHLSEFYLHAGQTAGQRPVRGGILNLDLQRTGDTVLLQWTAVSEREVSVYILERSQDSFQADIDRIDTLAAINDPLVLQDYQSLDSLVSGEITQYRVRAVRENGEIYYSGIRSINTTSTDDPSATADMGFSVYPNPGSGHYLLTLESVTKSLIGELQVEVLNTLGQKVRHRHSVFGTEIELQILEGPGLYFVGLYHGGQHAVRPVILRAD